MDQAFQDIDSHARVTHLPADIFEARALLVPTERFIFDKVMRYLSHTFQSMGAGSARQGEIPKSIFQDFKGLKIAGLTLDLRYSGQGRSTLLHGLVTEAMVRMDVSLGMFFSMHHDLAMHTLALCGSEQQKNEFLPAMARMDRVGAFVLSEPDPISTLATGLRTSCWRRGDIWILNGVKQWNASAPVDDIIVWARDVLDHQMKGFILDRKTNGIKFASSATQIFQRGLPNSVLELVDCPVAEECRLPHAHGLKDICLILEKSRAGIAWQAVGCACAIHEVASAEVQAYGRPGAFRYDYDAARALLDEMTSQITAMQTIVTRLSQLQDQDILDDAQTSLAQLFCRASCKSVLSLAQDLMGAHGILISNRVAKFLGDVEALYSFEATRDMNHSIWNRTMTGMSAFT
ncbi:MAG TPA: acyl-CoA dehydrogenase family protein [Oligoflexus sp.]|uniref:acyl-CoA dehydrogenase family protein n=1 Tax=Oligoflexus sp. TaxID=1971216 RepID=UPI002D3E3F11|nr:acyl-CoA dehydrogenase family protein [Oligoflexus sp.]HYX31773.1 acyl-CoA dehydrogenase family protein [Oligoflexus sp.]